MNSVPRLLDATERGEPQAAEELLPLVYDELRRLAAARMAHERAGQTLQATALVHEAWRRLLGLDHAPQSWKGRAHFFGAVAEAMRRILVDRARNKRRLNRAEGLRPVDHEAVPELPGSDAGEDENLLLVDEALQCFLTREPRVPAGEERGLTAHPGVVGSRPPTRPGPRLGRRRGLCRGHGPRLHQLGTRGQPHLLAAPQGV